MAIRYSSLQKSTSEKRGACLAQPAFFFRKRIDSGNPSRLSTKDFIRLYSFCFESSFRLSPDNLSLCWFICSSVLLICSWSSSSCWTSSSLSFFLTATFCSNSRIARLNSLSSASFDSASLVFRLISWVRASFWMFSTVSSFSELYNWF